MSPSAPYIYNPKECVILAYKKKHIKIVKGQPEWVGEMGEVEGKDGNMRPKMMYTEQQKREFIDLVFGQWNYFLSSIRKNSIMLIYSGNFLTIKWFYNNS